MKLVRMRHNQVAPLVLLPEGAFAIDVIRSLSVFAYDPLSNGILNGAFKEGGDWSSIVKHWAHLRGPLKKLVVFAQSYPEHPRSMFQPLNHDAGTAGAFDPIIAIEITDIENLEELDPTGRRAIQRQFIQSVEIETPSSSATIGTGQVIDFSLQKDDAVRS